MFEWSDKPLIWNMWGVQTAKAAVQVVEKQNGLVGLWVDNGVVVCACLMLRAPAPSEVQLEAVKGLIGKDAGVGAEAVAKL